MAGTEDVASFLREHVCDPREASYYADAFRSVGVRNLNVLRLWYRSLKDRNQLTETLGKHLDAVSIFARPALEDALIKAFGPPGSSGMEKKIAKRAWINTTASDSECGENEGPRTKTKKMDPMTEEDKVLGKQFREFVQQYDPDGRLGPLEFFKTYPEVTLSMLDRTFAQYSNEESTQTAIEAKLRYAICNNRKKGRKGRLSSGIKLSPKGKGGKPTGRHRRVHDYLQGIIASLNRDGQGEKKCEYDD